MLSRMSEVGERDVHRVHVGEREFIVVGTAHVSRESAELVRRVIDEERPDGVCIELDAGRYEALSQPQRFEALDLRQVIRTRQLSTLTLNLVLAAYQRSLGLKLGVKPGTELLEAARAAEERGIPMHLCDRDVRVTLRRAWRALGFWRKAVLMASLLGGLFEKQEISEEDLQELREADVLSRLLAELGEAFPGLKTVLIDERDAYLAERIRRSPGSRLVAVVGAGHVEGIRQHLEGEAAPDLEPLDEIPAASSGLRIIGWSIPALIVSALVAIGMQQGLSAAGQNLSYWILANGLPSALGALIAMAHPATIASAFVAAPITSLTPVIGAGYVTAFVQSYLRPPLVRELSTALEDLGSARGLWRNRLLRILLVFILTTLGSLIGTWVGAAEIFSNLFSG
jgi:pheromone shutdown-related protein TraB